MLKVRLMGTEDDIKWFGRFLQKNPQIEVLEMSELFHNKGTDRYYRGYMEISKRSIKEK